MSTSTEHEAQAMSRRSEILLVTGRELRTQLLKRSTLVSTVVVTALVVVGIIVAAAVTGSNDGPYRLGVTGADEKVTASLLPALKEATASQTDPVEVIDLAGTQGSEALSGEDPVDMVLDLSGAPRLLVEERADDQVAAAVTGVLQQRALSDQITALGGDPVQVTSTLATSAPEVVVLDPPTEDQEDFGPRYTVFMVVNTLMYMVMLGGGQLIAMGVVEEKASRIVEILLSCVRPTSLLAGKVLGIGTASIATTMVTALAGVITAEAVDIMPGSPVDLDITLVAMLVWMVVGFALFSVAFGAAGALVSRQEDVGSVTMPLIMLCVVPFMASIVMVMGDPQAVVWRVLAFVPPLSPFLMPARLVFGVSGWVEQVIALAIALACLPLLVRAAAGIYTRAVTRTGARVPLREVLRRAR